MIRRIAIRNFAVARELAIDLPPGLSVFTGETGAGKSIIVDALAFAFGGRGGRELVAPGADRAEVAVILSQASGAVSVERSVGLAGRSALRLSGATASTDDVRALGAEHLDIHGQSGQLALLRPARQLLVLDDYAGLASHRAEMAALSRELRAVRRRLQNVTSDAQERARQADRLTFERDEIRAAALTAGEDDARRAEQRRLANADTLRQHAAEVLDALDGSGIERAVEALQAIGEHDESASHLADAAALLQSTADDALRGARSYAESVESDPERLAEITDRLDLIARLKRKYGDTIAAVLDYAAEADEQLDGLSGAESTEEELRAAEESLAGRSAAVALELSRTRREAGARLVAATERELHLLGMAGAALAIGFECRDDVDGLAVALPDYEKVDARTPDGFGLGESVPRAFTESGVDRVEFLVSFNAGMSPKPLADVASGGETSRFLLALTAVFGTAASPRTIVLDEVDEGVGGRAGALVGDALARLAERHQVLCITHLPQVAAYASHHFVVRKHTDGRDTWSTVEQVDDGARVDELAEMLGGANDQNRAAAEALVKNRGAG
jgi:DNA repair protein RecN (Recombination protein N)